MADFINLDAAYDSDTLTDWYISSVGSEPPVWTDEHMEELLNDFYVIPKDTPAADVAPVRHGRWETGYFHDRVCSCCLHPDNDLEERAHRFCPNCGAKMDGGEGE